MVCLQGNGTSGKQSRSAGPGKQGKLGPMFRKY